MRRGRVEDDQNTTPGTDTCYRVLGRSEVGRDSLGDKLEPTPTYQTYRVPASSVSQLCPSCTQKSALGFHLKLKTSPQDGAYPSRIGKPGLSPGDFCPFFSSASCPLNSFLLHASKTADLIFYPCEGNFSPAAPGTHEEGGS